MQQLDVIRQQVEQLGPHEADAGALCEHFGARARVSMRSGVLPGGTSTARSFATIEVNVRDVSYDELPEIYCALRRDWRAQKGKGLSQCDAWLLSYGEVGRSPNIVAKLEGLLATRPQRCAKGWL